MPLLKDRELLKSGISILSLEKAAEYIVEHGVLEEHFRVEGCFDSNEYELISGNKVVENCCEDIPPTPDLTHSPSQVDELIDIIASSPRYDPKYDTRIELEMAFFEKTLNIKFLLRLHRMIEEFKEKGVVWGVGRGSAISSVILYILEIHDIDPCEYGIPFHELSKER